jgi:glycosyltransferase involved in cell wall biosynthesis
MSKRSKRIVVMPAYNAAQTLVWTYAAIPQGEIDEVILVDDGSADDTAEVAQRLGLNVIVHPHNAGYGANQKTCYMEALRLGADVVIMLHPDGQYDPAVIPDMISAVEHGEGDMVLASRFLDPNGPLRGGMPLYKFLANRFLTAMENLAMGTRLSECHTGYRAYNRHLLETVPFLRNSNDFVFDTQMIFQAQAFGFKIAEVPVSTRYFEGASSINFRRSMVYGLSTLGVAVRFILHRLGLRKSDLFTR